MAEDEKAYAPGVGRAAPSMSHARSHSAALSEQDQHAVTYFTPQMTRSRSSFFATDSPRRHRRHWSDPSDLNLVIRSSSNLNLPTLVEPSSRSPEKERDRDVPSRSTWPVVLARARRAVNDLYFRVREVCGSSIDTRERSKHGERASDSREFMLPTRWWLNLRRVSVILALIYLLLLALHRLVQSRRPPLSARLQRVLLPATVLAGGRNDFGVPTAGLAEAVTAARKAAESGEPPPKRPLRTCIIASSRLRPPSDAPIEDSDATLLGLARMSKALGHNTTLLLLRPPKHSSSTTQRGRHPLDWLRRDVRVELLYAPAVSTGAPTPAAAMRSHRVLEWLSEEPTPTPRTQTGHQWWRGEWTLKTDTRSSTASSSSSEPKTRCDVAHFVDATAEALYPLLAQRQRLALPHTLLVLHVISPLLWRLRRDASPLAATEHAAGLHMERLAIRSAPACGAWPPRPCASTAKWRTRFVALQGGPPSPQLIVPSGYMLAWLREHGPRPRPHAVTIAPPPVGFARDDAKEEKLCGQLHSSYGQVTARGNHRVGISPPAPIRLVLALDFRSPAEIALVVNALTLLQKHWREAKGFIADPPWGRVHVHMVSRLASVGPRGGSGYNPPWPFGEGARSWDPGGDDEELGDGKSVDGGEPFDGRRLVNDHAARHEWKLAYTVHGEGSRWPDLRLAAAEKGRKNGNGPSLLVLPLLSSSAPLDVRLATRCRMPWLSFAAGGVPASVSAFDLSRTAALLDPNATELAMRLDVMLRLRGASGWPRPTVAITDDAVHGWWSGWHSALLRGKHLGVTNGDSSSSSGEASSGEPTSSSPSSSTPHGKEMPDEEKEDVKGSFSSSKGGPGLCKGTSGASQLPSASIVMVVCSRPASRQAMWELRANLARAIPAAERAFDAVTSSLPEVAAGGSPVSGAEMLLVLPETHASSCYRRRATAGSRGHNDGHTSGEHTSGSFNSTDVDGPYSASRINTDGLLTGLRLTNWGLVHVPLSNSRNLRCDRPGSSSSSLSESESGRAAAPSSLAAIFGRVVRRLKSEYALVLEARTIVAPDALCALARAAASAAAASAASAAYPKGEEASERAFVAATRLWPAQTGVAGRGAGGRSRLALPLGGPMSLGAIRNTFGKLALMRYATLKRLWRAESGGGERGRPGTRGERCAEFVWQLLARASLLGLPIEPVPFALSDAPTPSSANGHSNGNGNAANNGFDVPSNADTGFPYFWGGKPQHVHKHDGVELMALRPLLAKRVASAGTDANGTWSSPTSWSSPQAEVSDSGLGSSWSPDALDMATVLAALQKLAGSAVTSDEEAPVSSLRDSFDF